MKCFRCGDCCKGIEFWITMQEYMKLLRVRDFHAFKGIESNRYFMKFDVCPFYDDVNMGCIMYNSRPAFCRMYHCGRLQPSDPRLSNAEVMKLAINNPEYKAFKDKLETDAAEWGNRNGWKFRRSNFLTLFYSSE